MIEDTILTQEKTVKLQASRRLCNRLLMIMLNCWRVNECWIVDITELLIQKLSALFATKNLSEIGGDDCDNLNFMNFKIDSFKIRKNSRILRTFKVHKIWILNLRLIPNNFEPSVHFQANWRCRFQPFYRTQFNVHSPADLPVKRSASRPFSLHWNSCPFSS